MPQNPLLFIYFQCTYLAIYIFEIFQKLLDFYIVSSYKLISIAATVLVLVAASKE